MYLVMYKIHDSVTYDLCYSMQRAIITHCWFISYRFKSRDPYDRPQSSVGYNLDDEPGGEYGQGPSYARNTYSNSPEDEVGYYKYDGR